ncbi:MAG: TetR/AcrR family transcriptional regulator [Dictyoglomus thermophilum]|uniref:TetR/AcrR family transcriptional regulator n=2 Tax=Pseudomonadati TaxID=3379134 RepID=A0A7C4JQ78_9BACT|nr:TetR/AcrR family transcriptional regulator [Dictyoglomus thermophilum]MCX7720903.1 TetR/AcrR family transcriptional regulator [Dictyoglomus thermophilum]
MPKKTFYNIPEEKRERITRTLIKYFAEKPYSKVDVEDIAKECGIAKGSMYQYFENKKDMYFYAIENATKRSLEILKDVNFENISLFEYVKQSFEFNWDFLLKYPYEYILLEKSAFYDDSPYREEIREYYEKLTHNILYDFVVKNQKAGFIRDDIPPEMIMTFIEGTSWAFKKFLVSLAKSKGMKMKDLSKEYVKELQNYYLKILEEGIGKKK